MSNKSKKDCGHMGKKWFPTSPPNVPKSRDIYLPRYYIDELDIRIDEDGQMIIDDLPSFEDENNSNSGDQK